MVKRTYDVNKYVFIAVVVTWLAIMLIISLTAVASSGWAFLGGIVVAWMSNQIVFNGKRLLG